MIEDDMLSGLEIAVIGMAGRFPGARNIHEYWENIKNGVESICFFSEEELDKAGVSPTLYNRPDFVKSTGGILEGMEYFDAHFFGYTPTEAELLDPQVRLFHECSWEALEDAGYDPGSYEGLIGLFAGAEDNIDWRKKVFLSDTEAGSQYSSMLLSCKDFVSARVSYKLNLKGPVYSLVTGCSTALTSIHLACRSLLGGECDMALAGGVYVHMPPLQGGYLYQEGRILSHDGHLRAFDAKASGTVFSSGIGVVVLKPLEDAREDNDHIYAMVKGSAVNCDGNRKVNFTAPSVKGQAKVIKAAYQAADVDPETIGYLETHGTGTRLGDPIEINALKQAFNNTPGWKCPIGSVKTNIGHLDVAAGAASFIKTVLILKHKLIPPSLNFETLNPKLELDNSPFYVNTQLQELQSNGAPRRAAVSSFGFGGTNAHAVLEEAPAVSKSVNQEVSESGGQLVNGQPTDSRGGSLCPPLKSRDNQLILLSAKTKTALHSMTENLVNFLKENRVNHDNPVNPGQNPGLTLANVAYTLQTGRQPFQYREVCVGSNVDEVIHILPSSRQGQAGDDPPVIFMFSGQGSQYVNMGLEIYHSEPIFREQMDHSFAILKSLTGKDFKEIFYPSADIAGAEEEMKDFRNIGPIKLIFEYSLAKLLMDWGIRPHALLGHSFGEYTAACLAGVFSIEEALKLALIRGELILRTPPGGMMSVPLPEDQLNQYLQSHPDIYLTAVNSSSLCFVSGLPEPLDRLEKELEQTGLECIRINVPCAGHSPMMKSITGEFAGRVREIKLQDPSIPFISGLTGDWVSPGQLSDPSYWATHLEQPVRFCQGLEKLLNEPGCIFLQVGADKGLPLFVNQHRDLKPGTPVLNLVRHKKDKTADMYFLLNQLGTLWLEGVNIDWRNFHARQQRQRIPLPTYPFEGECYWIDLNRNSIFSNFFSRGPLVKRENVSDWLYTSSWKRCPLVQESTGDPHEGPTLIFSDACQLGSRLAGKLEEKGREVIMVKPGEKFEQESQQVYRINPTEGGDYDRLFKTLNTKKKMPGMMIHLWNVTGDKAPDLTSTSLETTLDLGFYSLIHIVQSMGRLGIHDEVRLEVVTDNMQPVMDEKVLYPAKATILGAICVIPQEYPNISCFALDIILPEPGSPVEKQLLQQLVDTFTRKSPDIVPRVRAFRSNRYWTPVFESIPLGKTQPISPRLKEGGVYLLTGGLGGIGFVLAQYLVKTVNARLILTGRSQLPAKDQWQQWLDEHQQEDRVSQRIKKVMDLEKSGAEVLVFSADSADQKQMQEVITRAVKHFGQINGIIHTAGLVDFHGVIQNRTREMTENILAPKVRGTMILDMLTRHMPLDFFIICSSIASLFPGFGEVGYAAANIFIDAFAHYKNLTGTTFTAAVNWDTWQEVGGAVEAARKQREAGKTSYIQLKDGILNTEGIEAFTLILQNSNPQVVVSTKDLHLLLQQRLTKPPEQDQTELEEEGEKITQRDLRPRPQLNTPYVAPENPTQKILAKIWQEYFGIDQVGIRDDFFELGGDSLMATVMAARIHKRMNIRIPLTVMFSSPTIKELVEYIKEANEDIHAAIQPVEKKEYCPTSSAQKRLFILDQFEDIGTSYNVPGILRVKEKMDKTRYENTVKALIDRHEALRTSFQLVDNEPVQRIHYQVDFEIRAFDSTADSTGEDNSRMIKNTIKHFIRPFDLCQAPLLRGGFIKLAKDEHLFLFDMHHIISDGTSMEILIDDFIKLYHGEELLPLAVQYKDFTCWQNDLFETGKIKKQENYWKNLLPDVQEIPRLNLPLDYPRPDIFTFEGGIYRLVLDGETTSRLKRLCAKNGGTLFMNLVAALNVLLYKYTSQDDIIIGSSIAGRPHNDLQPVIGMFVNELIIRNHPRGEKQYPEFFEKVKESCLNAFENQDVQFEDLVDKLNPERDPSRNPIFDVCLVVLNFEKSKGEIKGASFTPYSSEITTSKFDITIFAVDADDKILFNLEYCRSLFKKETMERLARHFKNIIQHICKKPDSQLYDLEIFDEEEKQQLLYECNQTDTQYARDRTTHELFEKQVEKTSDRTAVVFKNQSLCYSALEAKANQVANYLLITKHVLPDDRVGILMNRSIELIVSIMGILKAGAAYIPIETSSPEERIKNIINDAGIEIVISQKRYIKILNRLQWECKDFHMFLCMDSRAVHMEEEMEKNELMDEKLWEYVGENASDEITGGGWISSYTGQPFSKEEMEEYGDNILKKLTPLLHEKMRVLEIGCASGITMYRIAPHVGFYYGTDLSRVIIQKNEEQVKRQGQSNIALTCLPAHEIHKLDETDFDLVILNSVIQSFHGHNYLRKVIAGCINLLREKGFIFIGDIMNQQLKKKLIQDLNAFKQANQSNATRTKVDWSSELFVSPGFFQDLTVEIPGIQAVEFSDKIHTIPNELTKFRYDALLTIDKGKKPKRKIKAKQKYQEDLTLLQPLSINRPGVPMNSRNLAYIIYTSGTTGIPKGVMIRHQSLVNYVQWGIQQYINGDHYYFPLYTSISFDLTVTSIFLPLLSGGVIVVYPDGQSGLPILDVFEWGGVQVVKATPSHLKLLQGEVKRVHDLKRFIVGGEALERTLAADIYRDFSGEIEIYNEYGPTEATVGCMIYKFDYEHDRRNMVPIGVPIDNAKIFILDRDMNPVPTNAMGEIYIGGDALTRGYVNQPELTAEKICLRRPGGPLFEGTRGLAPLLLKLLKGTGNNPMQSCNHATMQLSPYRSTYYPVYRTGDLAKRLADGNIEFLGRRDDQVKIRGYRIEIEEIENRLKQHNDIKEVVILMLKRTPDLSDLVNQTDDYLCCYWVPTQARVSLDTVEIKTYLAKHMPDYMIPSYFVQLEKIPLTPNGKVNRKALPEPGVVEVGDDYIAPANDVERKLVEIWSQVLGIEKNIIGTRSNFFQLGGHSLRATIVVSKIHKELNVKIPLAEIFKNPVIEELAQYIILQEKDIYEYIKPVEKREYYPQSSAQKRLFFLEQLENIGTSYNMPHIFNIRGEILPEHYERIFKTLIERHETLRTSLALIDNQPVQIVHDRFDFEIEMIDAPGKHSTIAPQLISDMIKLFVRPFDLAKTPLLRVGLMKISREEHLLLFDMHHIIGDGTSTTILSGDFMQLYMGNRLTPLKIQYKDFSRWQNDLFATGRIKEQEKYWLNLYSDTDSIPRLDLPTDYPRREVFDFDGAVYHFVLKSRETAAFKELTEEYGVTLYMNLLAAFNVLLHKYTRQEDIIVGTGIAGRPHVDLENIIGMFVNTLPIRNYPQGEKTYLEFLQEVKNNCLKAFENQDMQFEELVNRICVNRTSTKNPIFSVELNIQNYEPPIPARVTPGSTKKTRISPYGFENTTSKFDMILYATETGDKIKFMLEYSTALFKSSTIEKIAVRYIQILEQVVEDKTIQLKDIDITPELAEASLVELHTEFEL